MLELGHVPYDLDPHTGGYRISPGFYLQDLQVKKMLPTRNPVPSSPLPLVDQPPGPALPSEGVYQADPPQARAALITRRDGPDGLFQKLASAIDLRRVCRLLYRQCLHLPDLCLTVLPVGLSYRDGAWYVLAGSLPHSDLRRLRLAHIVELTVTGEVSCLPFSSEMPLDRGRILP